MYLHKVIENEDIGKTKKNNYKDKFCCGWGQLVQQFSHSPCNGYYGRSAFRFLKLIIMFIL